MSAEQTTPQEWIIPALVSNICWHNEQGFGKLQLSNADQIWQCHTFMEPWIYKGFGSESAGFARIIPSTNTANEPIYLMVDFRFEKSLKALYYVHADFCPIEGIVDQARALVHCIHHAGLRELVEDALSMQAVSNYFWTCPASIRDHHCNAGGLAQHSVEVATMIACSDLDTPDKDIGIAFALLHDIGKVNAYADGKLTQEACEIGHEGIGFNLLEPLLDKFKQHDESTGKTLIELLNGTWKRTTKDRRPLAIGRVVNAFDQLSCERNLLKQIKNPPADSFHCEDVAFLEW